MAVTKIILFQFLILATVQLLMAENGGPFGLPMPSGDKAGEEHHDRFFFNNPGLSFAACNYTATPGRSCLSCNRTQTCMQSGLGIIRACHGRNKFCSNGACVRTPTAACNGTANATTTP